MKRLKHKYRRHLPVRRSPVADDRPGTVATPAPPDDAGRSRRNETAQGDLRCRLSCAGQLVRDVFGFDRHDDPSLVTRDAYLIVVSRIIEAITTKKDELSTDDLVALSKALAEHRRLNTAQLEIERRFPEKGPGDDAPAADPDRALPAGFGRVVEQIYGTNLSSPSDGSPSPDKQIEDRLSGTEQA